MLKKIKSFFTEFIKVLTNRKLYVWTIWYFLVLYFIFKFLFNFDILFDWVFLANASLNGFSGFVFGTVLIAALPLYVASAALIKRNNKPLITFVKPVDKKKESAPTTDIVIQKKSDVKFPEFLPAELHEQYIRMQTGQLTRANSFLGTGSNSSISSNTGAVEISAPGVEIPLPEHFDFDSDSDKTQSPVFHEITFNDYGYNNDSGESVVLPKFILDLQNSGYDLSYDNDVFIAKSEKDTLAVAVHDDSEFWVPDDVENWFANGKQKTSPIKNLLNVAKSFGAHAVFLLLTPNILNFDECVSRWEKMGIQVITD